MNCVSLRAITDLIGRGVKQNVSWSITKGCFSFHKVQGQFPVTQYPLRGLVRVCHVRCTRLKTC